MSSILHRVNAYGIVASLMKDLSCLVRTTYIHPVMISIQKYDGYLERRYALRHRPSSKGTWR